MSRNGQLALQRLIITYSPIGEPAGVRQALAREIPLFKRKYPSVVIDLRPSSTAAANTSITALYKDGSEKAISTTQLSAQGIWVNMHKLANSCNDHNAYFHPVHTHFQRTTVQGVWNPYLWLAERHEPRTPTPRWDRKLTEGEWGYYVKKYSQRLAEDEATIAAAVSKKTDLPQKMTQEVAARWAQHVAPHLQTDMEANLAHVKAQAAEGVHPAAPTMGEYRLFSMPELSSTGRDLTRALRTRETKRLQQWWAGRESQLKPPM